MNRFFVICIALICFGCAPSEEEQRQFSGKYEGKMVSGVEGLAGAGHYGNTIAIRFTDGSFLEFTPGENTIRVKTKEDQ